MNIRCLYDECLPISQLKGCFHPRNRNQHSEDQIQRLAEILKYQGIRYPVKISKQSGAITSGHGRVLAAELNGWNSFPVNYQDYDDETQEYADVQADNAIASWAELDLSGINMDIGELGPFDINMLGIKDFTVEPLDRLEPQCDEDEVPEKVEPRTKLGDIYQLGRHRLMCGDSTSIDAVEKLMNGEKADMVFTDPPYGIDLEPDRSNKGDLPAQERMSYLKSGNPKGKSYPKVLGDTEESIPELINSIFASFDYVSEMYIWGSDYFSELIPDRNRGSWIVWDKRCDESADKMFGSSFELCWSKSKHKRDIARIRSGIFGVKDDSRTRVHPTQKPVQLVEWFFSRWGKSGDNLVDLFGGSGSTLIACEKTNRRCFMMELDPHYCDVIVARWEKFTGKKATLLTEEVLSV